MNTPTKKFFFDIAERNFTVVTSMCRMLALFKEAADPGATGRGIYFSPECNATVTQQSAFNTPLTDDSPLWKQSNPDFWWNDEITKPLRRMLPTPAPLRLCRPGQVTAAKVLFANVVTDAAITDIA